MIKCLFHIIISRIWSLVQWYQGQFEQGNGKLQLHFILILSIHLSVFNPFKFKLFLKWICANIFYLIFFIYKTELNWPELFKINYRTFVIFYFTLQPKQVTDIKEFLELVSRQDTRSVVIKKNPENVKFKARTSRYLVTLVVKDSVKAEKLIKMLPSSVSSTIIN